MPKKKQLAYTEKKPKFLQMLEKSQEDEKVKEEKPAPEDDAPTIVLEDPSITEEEAMKIVAPLQSNANKRKQDMHPSTRPTFKKRIIKPIFEASNEQKPHDVPPQNKKLLSFEDEEDED